MKSRVAAVLLRWGVCSAAPRKGAGKPRATTETHYRSRKWKWHILRELRLRDCASHYRSRLGVFGLFSAVLGRFLPVVPKSCPRSCHCSGRRSGHCSGHRSVHRIFALHDANTPRGAAIGVAAVEAKSRSTSNSEALRYQHRVCTRIW